MGERMGLLLFLLLLVVMTTRVAGDQSHSSSRSSHGNTDVIDNDGKYSFLHVGNGY